MFKTAQLFALATIVAVVGGVASAQPATNIQPQPGLIGANSALYPIDTAVNSFSIGIGLQSEGDVAFERASEYSQAVDRGKDAAADRALNNLNELAMNAGNNSTTGLDRAEQVLQQVRDRTPDAANQGLDNALENVRENRERLEERRNNE